MQLNKENKNRENMENNIVKEQIQQLCETLNFAPVTALVKCHQLYEYVVTKKVLKEFYKIPEEYILKMNQIKNDELFGADIDDDYVYLLQEAIFLGIVFSKKTTGVDKAMAMYSNGITVKI